VAVVVLENHGPAALLRHGWLAGAARHGAVATRAVGEPHPAQPYLVMLSGSTRPLSDAAAVARPVSVRNLTDQLDAHGVPWKAYMDAMPSPCFAGAASGLYVKRHDPFVFLSDVVSDRRDCRSDVVPGDRLTQDVARRRLPPFVWITPNVCQDMHSCPVGAGERWMSSVLPRIVRALGARGVLFVVGDELSPRGHGGGAIPLVALGGAVRRGAVDPARVDHRALLATIEDVLGLGRLPATRTAPTLRAMLRY
jgi:hypothetical protein